MNKIWINKDRGEDKIIAFGDNKLFKANPRDAAFFQYADDIEKNAIPNDVLSIPFAYIKTIQHREGKKYLQIFFGEESEEYFRINDPDKLNELFQYFKENIPRTGYRFEQYSALKAGKKPMIAVVLFSALFIWTLSLAIQIEMGTEYELIGNGRSITGIVFGIANLGVYKVTLIFSIIIGLALFSMIRKMRNRPAVHEIYFIRKQ